MNTMERLVFANLQHEVLQSASRSDVPYNGGSFVKETAMDMKNTTSLCGIFLLTG